MDNYMLPSLNSAHQVQIEDLFSSNSESSNPLRRHHAPLPPPQLHSVHNPPPILDEYPDDVEMPVVHIRTMEVEPQVSYWRSGGLIGHFVGPIPANVEMQSLLASLWNVQFTVRTYEDDLLLISFANNVEDANRVLAGSPWPLPGCYLILKSWEPGLSPHRVDIGLVPTRISLWELPIEYWEFPILAKVVEPIGALISVEGEHSTYSNIRVLRALVLVDVQRKRRYQLTVRCGRRCNVVGVTYDDNPRVCIVCGGFGHSHVNCDGGAGAGKDWSRTNEGSVDFPPTNSHSQGQARGGGFGGAAHESQGNGGEGSDMVLETGSDMMMDSGSKETNERAFGFGGVVGESVPIQDGGDLDVTMASEYMAIFDELDQQLKVGLVVEEEDVIQSNVGDVQDRVTEQWVCDVHDRRNPLRGLCMETAASGVKGHVQGRVLMDPGLEVDDPLPSTDEVIQQLRLGQLEESREPNLVGLFDDVSFTTDGVQQTEIYNSIPASHGTLEDVIRGVALRSETLRVVGKVGSSTAMAAEELREFAKRMEEQEKIDGIPNPDEKMVVVVLSSDSSGEIGERGKKRKSKSLSAYERAVAVSARVRGRNKVDLLKETKERRLKRARYPVRKLKKSKSTPCTTLTLALPSQEQEEE